MEKAKTADDSLAKIEAAVQMWEASQKRQELEVLLERARKSPHVIPSAVAKLELLLAQSQTTTRELLHIAA